MSALTSFLPDKEQREGITPHPAQGVYVIVVDGAGNGYIKKSEQYELRYNHRPNTFEVDAHVEVWSDRDAFEVASPVEEIEVVEE